ncbi:MAG: hypothetical protein J7K34_09270 [Flavobacteriaceae bacterium]|nr:hypothetical protein [Flavobacteriaceae bacterium]
MKKNIISLGILLLFVGLSFAQSNIDAYKYIIVPDKYDTFNEADKYQLNSLSKFLFEKYGFQTLNEGVGYPSDLMKNPCLAVTAHLVNQSNMFTTKVSIDLKDCYNKVVYSSEVGKSKIKAYDKSFKEALRNTFISFKDLDYSYDFNKSVNANQVVVNANPVKVVPPEVVSSVTPIVEMPKKKVVPMVALVPAKPTVTENVKTENKSATNSISKSYKNENISFMLIDQNNKMVAYVKSSNNKNYKNGEMIGTFTKTSLPNVYRATWKNQDGKFENTTGYIDDAGNLKVDINKNGKIEVVVFEVEK